MAVGFLSGGVDLSSVFEPRRGTTQRANTGFLSGGVDLAATFMDKTLAGLPSAAASAQGIKIGTADLNTIFQPLGYAPGTTSRLTITSGSGTWYASNYDGWVGYRIKSVAVSVIAAGGAGGGVPGTFNAGMGGGGGGCFSGLVDVSSGSVVYSVPPAVSGTTGSGASGGSCSFGTASATGGGGGLTASNTGSSFGPSAGGSPNGGSGSYFVSGSDYFSPSGAGTSTVATFQGNVVCGGGAGGADNGSYKLGGGGSQGAGGAAVGLNSNGNPGITPGGGGSGCTSSGSGYTGGAGARGEIRVYY